MKETPRTVAISVGVLIVEYFVIQPLKQVFSPTLALAAWLGLQTHGERLAAFALLALLTVTGIGLTAWLRPRTQGDRWVAFGAMVLLTAAGVAAWGMWTVGLGLWPAVTAVAGGMVGAAGLVMWRVFSPPKKTIILVAEFEGPEGPKKYRFGAAIREKLREALRGAQGIAVEALGRAIAENEGKEAARREGKRRKATIVIWGWYGHGEGAQAKVLVEQHIEMLRKLESLQQYMPRTEGKAQEYALVELESYVIQRRLAADAACVTSFTVGLARMVSGDAAGALPWLDRAVEQAGRASDAVDRNSLRFARGTARLEAGNVAGAVEDLDEAVRLKSDDAEAYVNRGMGRALQEQLEQAIQDFDKAIRLKPNLAEAYYNRGLAHKTKGHYERAIQDFAEAIGLRPKWGEAYFARGATYLLAGDREKAVADLKRALEFCRDPKVRAFAEKLLEVWGGSEGKI